MHRAMEEDSLMIRHDDDDVCVLQRGHSGNGCDLASTLCKYDFMKGDYLS